MEGGVFMVIFENMYLTLTGRNGIVYIQTKKEGFQLKDFDTILRQYPRIKLNNFSLLKTALSKIQGEPLEIGEWLPVVVLEVARDQMSASIFINEKIDYIRENKELMMEQIMDLLSANKIVHGVIDINLEEIVPGKACLIAQGTPPKKGEDAKVTYLDLPERKPVIKDDGTANYFDMNFIFEIKEGSWLGEKIPLQIGIRGTNIFGKPVAATPGKDAILRYDKKSAYINEEEGKTVLRSRINGVVEEVHGILQIKEHLTINGDVGVDTGNIEFDGAITIRGTVQSGFTVIAKGDIAIESPEGVSSAKLIKSREGDIFIRGGIYGLGKTRVEAGGNIFVKHVNEAILVAEEDIHIGFYALGSNLSAHSVLVNERSGKIIGGTVIAKNVIQSAITGNLHERRTELIIHSINKQDGLKIIQGKASYLKSIQEDVLELEAQVQRIAPLVNNLNTQQLATYEQARQRLKRDKEQVAVLDREIKQMMNDLRNVGKEEIYVTKEAHPGTYIQIGKKSTILSRKTNGKFILEFGELNV